MSEAPKHAPGEAGETVGEGLNPTQPSEGLTPDELRAWDQYAAAALGNRARCTEGWSMCDAALAAKYADAMIAERRKRGGG